MNELERQNKVSSDAGGRARTSSPAERIVEWNVALTFNLITSWNRLLNARLSFLSNEESNLWKLTTRKGDAKRVRMQFRVVYRAHLEIQSIFKEDWKCWVSPGGKKLPRRSQSSELESDETTTRRAQEWVSIFVSVFILLCYVRAHGCMKLHFQNQFISLLHERIDKRMLMSMISTMLSFTRWSQSNGCVSYRDELKTFPFPSWFIKNISIETSCVKLKHGIKGGKI